MTRSRRPVDQEKAKGKFEEIAKQQEEYKEQNPPKVTDAEIVACFDGSGDNLRSGNELRTGHSIAEELEVHPKTIYRRLKKLEEKNIVESHDLGSVRAWHIKGATFTSFYTDRILKRLKGSMGEDYE